MRITVDPSRYIAAGQCVLKAPKVFDQEEEQGTVVLLAGRPAPEDEENARLAARVCPSEAITIHENE